MRKWLQYRVVRSGVCLCATAVVTAASAFGVAGQEGTKRALIIAIGEYGVAPNNPVTSRPALSYRDLSSANDVVLVRGALERQGFLARDIRVLADAEATPDGVRSALQLLARETEEGDVVVIHYSGHGDKLTNDNPDEDDEVDGYDEVLVPYGSTAEKWEGYDGSLHLRDDEFGEYIARIRANARRTGSVTVFLDACYSGTATRGSEEGLVRGQENPLGAPAFAAGRAPTTRGTPEADRGTGLELAGADAPNSADVAPFVVFSAASPRQMAKEVKDVDGRTPVGSLSYALSRALAEARPGTTNAGLFAALTRSLIGKVSNQTPQMEGDGNVALFSNRVTQQLPYVVVDSAVAGGVELAGGTLIGLNPGTRLAVHPLGTATPDRSVALAELEVSEASATRSLARVTSGALADAGRGAWAFVTRRTYGELVLRVRLDSSLPDVDRAGLSRRFEGSGMVQLVPEGGDVVVAERDGQPEARATTDDRVLGAGAQAVGEAVESYARNRYLRRLDFGSPELDVVLEVVPVEFRSGAGCTLGDWARAENRPEYVGAGQWLLRPSETYRARVRNVGSRRVYAYLVELRPGGQTRVLSPASGQWGDQLEPGTEVQLCVRLPAADVGQLVLKVFATEARQDLRPWFVPADTRSGRGEEPDRAVSQEVIINIQPN